MTHSPRPAPSQEDQKGYPPEDQTERHQADQMAQTAHPQADQKAQKEYPPEDQKGHPLGAQAAHPTTRTDQSRLRQSEQSTEAQSPVAHPSAEYLQAVRRLEGLIPVEYPRAAQSTEVQSPVAHPSAEYQQAEAPEALTQAEHPQAGCFTIQTRGTALHEGAGQVNIECP